MGTPVPLLPYRGEKEYKTFAQYALERGGAICDQRASIDWVQYIDGVDIQAKLPSHIRTHNAKFDRNVRIKQTVANMENEIERLREMNRRIAPVNVQAASIEDASSAEEIEATNESGAVALVNQSTPSNQPDVSTNFPATEPNEVLASDSNGRDTAASNANNVTIPSNPNRAQMSRKESSGIASNPSQVAVAARTSQSNTNSGLYHTWPKVRQPESFTAPPASALHQHPFVAVGGVTIGKLPDRTRMKRVRHCNRCQAFGSTAQAMQCTGNITIVLAITYPRK